MSLHATSIEHTFVSILALYVTLECAVTILQTRAAEKSCGRVPEGFEKKLTLAGIRKAADYTGELAQANLLLTVVGAGFALFMTFGNGLNVFTAVIETIMGPGIPADWVLISLIVLLMLLIELPFGWWARYRVKERYGYMREPRMRWLSRTLSEALWGWLVFMPVSAALLTIFEYAGGDWWKLAWGVWLVYLLWRWKLSSVYGVFWKRRSRPLCERRNPRGRSGEPAPSGHHHDRNGRHDPPRLLGPLQHRALGLGPQAPRHRLRARRAPAQEGRDRRARRPRGRTRAPLPRRAPPPHQRRRLLHLLLARGLGRHARPVLRGFQLFADAHARHARHPCGQRLRGRARRLPHASLPALAPAQPRRTPHAVRRGPARRAHRGTRPDDQRPREAAQGHDDISLAVPRLFALSLQASAPRHARCEPAAPQAPCRRPAAGSSTSFRSPPSPERPKRTKLPHQQPFFAAHVRSRTSATVPWPKLRPASTVRLWPKLPAPSSQAASPQATAATTS